MTERHVMLPLDERRRFVCRNISSPLRAKSALESAFAVEMNARGYD